MDICGSFCDLCGEREMIASSYLACVGGGASLSHSSHVQSALVYPAQTVTEVD